MKVTPVCPVFSSCGGCQYQDISYSEELCLKEQKLKQMLATALPLKDKVFEPILASPQDYYYRNRLDLKLQRTKGNGILMGFSPAGTKRMVEVDQCFIARREISNFLPELKRQAMAMLPSKYKIANLVVRCGDGPQVCWGGIGHGSNRLKPKDYLWTELVGRRLHYSLETFFQANLSILFSLVVYLRGLPLWSKEAVFFDLYGGVGLFGVALADLVQRVVHIEENKISTEIARYNKVYNHLDNFDVYENKVEDVLPELLGRYASASKIMMVDPPRAGLSDQVVDWLNRLDGVDHLLYLSCNPESLAANLKNLHSRWQVRRIKPLDFFPRTRHLETLVLLHS